MEETTENLRPASPDDLAQAIAFALRNRSGKRVRFAGEVMAEITARHLVESLAQAGFVVMQKPPASGGAALGRGPSG